MAPTNALQLAGDPVVLVSQSSGLGLSLSNNVEAEVLILLDRADQEFESQKFFAFSAPDGSVVLRWFDDMPAGHSVLGRLVYVTIPFLSSMGGKKSGFLEDDDGFNF